MTFWQRLRWVEIPMALPVIFGGIRPAVVMNSGVLAIDAVIGAGGSGLLTPIRGANACRPGCSEPAAAWA